MGVLPSDHHIADDDAFAAAAARAFALAEERGAVVAIGARPTRPETGFGYLELGEPLDGDGARAVRRFVEKPSATRRGRDGGGGGYLWNTGMCFARADRLLADIERHLPDTHGALAAIGRALERGRRSGGGRGGGRALPGPALHLDRSRRARAPDRHPVRGRRLRLERRRLLVGAGRDRAGRDGRQRLGRRGGRGGGARGNIAVADPGRLSRWSASTTWWWCRPATPCWWCRAAGRRRCARRWPRWAAPGSTASCDAVENQERREDEPLDLSRVRHPRRRRPRPGRRPACASSAARSA